MTPQPSEIALKAACALIEVGGWRGTGFLVAAERILTCNHVICTAGEGPILVRFPHGRYEAIVDLVDAQNDCALLRLTEPVPASHAQPLAIATAQIQKNDLWEGYGFPAVTEQAGLLVDGRVQDPLGQDRALRPAVVLQSASVTAGSELDGFSGSPVLVKGKVIGQMRSIIPDRSGGAQMAVVYACPADVLADLARRRLGAGAFQAPNPYRGLAAFRAADAHVFFGREKLTEKLWQHFRSMYERPGAVRILAVLGPSGSGKSSVALAGLVPALQARPVPGLRSLRIVQFNPGDRPLESLSRALVPLLPPESTVLPASRAIAIEELLRNRSRLGEGLRRFAADLPDSSAAPLVVVVDQFEEVYTLCHDSVERDLFVELLLHAAQAQAQSEHVSAVLTLRSDFLGETQRHHNQLNRLIAEQGVIVPALSPVELRDAIAKPAQQAGHPIDEATVELLLCEERSNQGALPLLEFALTRIWEGMEQGEEPGATLRKLGGVGGAMAGEAQRIYKALSDPEQATARRALVRLVRLGEGTRDTRRRAPLRELCGSSQTEADVLAVLRKFATENARLVTLSGDGAATVAEATHEALFDHWSDLREWINENRADRRLHDRAAEAARLWDMDKRHPGRLWRPPDLDLLRDYRKRRLEDLNPLQAAFLQAAEQRQQRERIIAWVAATAIFVALAIAAGIYIIKERQRAAGEHQRRQDADKAGELIRQQLLDTYVEQGRALMVEKGKPIEALLWLHRAQTRHSTNLSLPVLLGDVTRSIESTRVVLVGHADSVLSATYSPNGHRIVTASRDKTARVWDADTGHLLAVLRGHRSSVSKAAYSPDGRRIVTASSDQTARVWDADTGRFIFEFKGHDGSVNSARYSPDGRHIVTASADQTARLWDADSGRLLMELKGPLSSIFDARYNPDSRRIVTASEDQTARVWDVDSGRLLVELKGHKSYVWSVEYSPDGRSIVTASEDETARLWDAATGGLVAELKTPGVSVNSATYSPDGRRIVTTSADGSARVWDVDTGCLLTELKGHVGGVWSSNYSPDGRHIVTASADHTARVWAADGGRRFAELKGHQGRVSHAIFSPDGRHIVTASDDYTARVWETETSRVLAVLPGHMGRIWSAAYSPDGTYIITASADHTARVWEADSGRLVRELKGHRDGISGATYSPDGRHILTASWDETARVWEPDSGRMLMELTGHRGRLWSATYSPDGRHIVTASDDHTARVWDTDTGRLRAVLRGHGDSVLRAIYSPDGRHIVTASGDSTARVWEADTGHLLTVLQGIESAVWSVAYSPDGRRIVTAGDDENILVWEADSGRLLVQLEGHEAAVWSAAYSPDGHRIVTASRDETARVWEADSGRLLAVLKGHKSTVWSAAYSPDGHRILTASGDQTARVWDLSPENRTADQISKLIGCWVSARFESEDSTAIVHVIPNPTSCQANLASRP